MCVSIGTKKDKEKPKNMMFEVMNKWQSITLNHQVKPVESALAFAIIQLANQAFWPKELGLPTMYLMQTAGIASYNTYKKALERLNEINFLSIQSWSKNQYTATTATLHTCTSYEQSQVEGHKSALRQSLNSQSQDKDMEQNYADLQEEVIELRKQKAELEAKLQSYEVQEAEQRLEQTNDPEDKPVESDKEECPTNYDDMFAWFWETYNFKQSEHKVKIALADLSYDDYPKIFKHLPEYLKSVETKSKQYWKRPLNYLLDRCFEDEIVTQDDVILKGEKAKPERAVYTTPNYYTAPQKKEEQVLEPVDLDAIFDKYWKRSTKKRNVRRVA